VLSHVSAQAGGIGLRGSEVREAKDDLITRVGAIEVGDMPINPKDLAEKRPVEIVI
jgi:hypothetical protein